MDRISALGLVPLYDVDVHGARNLKLILMEAYKITTIFITPTSLTAFRERLIEHAGEGEHIERRMETARHEISESHNYDFRITDDNIERAVVDVERIVQIRREMEGN